MANYYLAVDIGASSGRHILSHIKNGKLIEEEIHRFYNGAKKENGTLYWDTEHLFSEVIKGIKKCKELGKIPLSVGVDTWGVDYLLLDENDEPLSEAVAYRDSRTEGIPEKVYEIISEAELYSKTGIQKQNFNTIFQLYAEKLYRPEILDKTKTLLFMPDWLHFKLSGVKAMEYTIASTSGFVNAETKTVDEGILTKLGIRTDIFPSMKMPGTVLGDLTEEIKAEVGFNMKVILPPSHDTASAVLGTPFAEDAIYISSGTWSLMGVELKEPITTEEAMKLNFTNEGGFEGRYRFLRNIMGLWMIQSLKKELSDKYSFGELCSMAEEARIDTIVDANSNLFLAPDSMIEAIKSEAKRTNQQIPETVGELAKVIYRSLAVCYREAALGIEAITGKSYDLINIVGGGSNAEYLNRLCAAESKKTVYAGPSEATAIGNLLSQMIALSEISSVKEARELVNNSTDMKIYKEA